MKQYYRYLYRNAWKASRKLISKLVKSKDDDDSPFDHPWAIL